jgi:hypothetical protein
MILEMIMYLFSRAGLYVGAKFAYVSMNYQHQFFLQLHKLICRIEALPKYIVCGFS